MSVSLSGHRPVGVGTDMSLFMSTELEHNIVSYMGGGAHEH